MARSFGIRVSRPLMSREKFRRSEGDEISSKSIFNFSLHCFILNKSVLSCLNPALYANKKRENGDYGLNYCLDTFTSLIRDSTNGFYHRKAKKTSL